MHRYWVELDVSSLKLPPAGTRLGCGVTAIDKPTALALLKARVFGGRMPEVLRVIEDVDVSALDAHVRPNMGNPAAPGVWFPLGFA